MSCAQVAGMTTAGLVAMRSSCPRNPGAAPGGNKRKTNKNEQYGAEVLKPGPHDVLLGRGGGTNNHMGNINFRKLVNEHKMRYLSCSKIEKPNVAREVVELWSKLNPPGRFLARKEEKKNGEGSDPVVWIEVPEKKAREKASQCLRERTPDVVPYIRQLREQQDQMTEQGVTMVQQQLKMQREAEAQKNSMGGMAGAAGYPRRASMAEHNPYQNPSMPQADYTTSRRTSMPLMQGSGAAAGSAAMMGAAGGMTAQQQMAYSRRVSAPHLTSSSATAGMSAASMMAAGQMHQAAQYGMMEPGYVGSGAAADMYDSAYAASSMTAMQLQQHHQQQLQLQQLQLQQQQLQHQMQIQQQHMAHAAGMQQQAAAAAHMNMRMPRTGYEQQQQQFMMQPVNMASRAAAVQQAQAQAQAQAAAMSNHSGHGSGHLSMSNHSAHGAMNISDRSHSQRSNSARSNPTRSKSKSKKAMKDNSGSKRSKSSREPDAPRSSGRPEDMEPLPLPKPDKATSHTPAAAAAATAGEHKPDPPQDPLMSSSSHRSQSKRTKSPKRGKSPKKASKQKPKRSKSKSPKTTRKVKSLPTDKTPRVPTRDSSIPAVVTPPAPAPAPLAAPSPVDDPLLDIGNDSLPLGNDSLPLLDEPDPLGSVGGAVGVSHDDDEVGIEEYRKTLETYMENNNITANNNPPASYFSDEDSLSVESFPEWGGEGDHPERDPPAPKRRGRAPPGSRGVDRHKSGQSMMSCESRRTFKSNTTSFSGLSMLSGSMMSMETRSREDKMGAAKKFSSNASIMSELTDISHTIDGLGLDDDV